MSAPASYSSPQIFSVKPKPCAAFSALTIARSTARSRFRPGRCALTASRPERPTTSPHNKMFKENAARIGNKWEWSRLGRRLCKPTVALHRRWAPCIEATTPTGTAAKRDIAAPGLSGLTHRAAPLLTTYLRRLHPRRNGLDAPGDLVEVRSRGFAGRVVHSRAGPRAVLLPLQGVVGVRQLVGDRKRRQQDQRHLANLPEFVGELADLGIDVLRKAAEPRFLPVSADNGEVAAVDLHDELGHLTPRARAACRALPPPRRCGPPAPQRLRQPRGPGLPALPDPPPLPAERQPAPASRWPRQARSCPRPISAPSRTSAASGCRPGAARPGKIAATASRTPRRHIDRRASRRSARAARETRSA